MSILYNRLSQLTGQNVSKDLGLDGRIDNFSEEDNIWEISVVFNYRLILLHIGENLDLTEGIRNAPLFRRDPRHTVVLNLDMDQKYAPESYVDNIKERIVGVYTFQPILEQEESVRYINTIYNYRKQEEMAAKLNPVSTRRYSLKDDFLRVAKREFSMGWSV